jgi:hypothetical protein
MVMYRNIADALSDGGRFICSVEHDDLMRQLLGLPIARRYNRGGIFIEHFDIATMHREVAPYFLELRIRRIRLRIPFAYRLPLAWAVRILRTVSAMPVLRRFGEILLLRAERPVRLPAEGVNRPGNRLVKGIFHWYSRRIGKEPEWDGNERV